MPRMQLRSRRGLQPVLLSGRLQAILFGQTPVSLLRGAGRFRALLRFLFAVAWVVAAYYLAGKAAHGFSRGHAFPLIRDIFEVFLLIVGYCYMELAWDNVRDPLAAIGLAFNSGSGRQFAAGVALGWGMVTGILLAIVAGAHFYVQVWTSLPAWRLLVFQILVLAAASLAAEIAFRGYAFQKLVQATGPFMATVLAAIFFVMARLETSAVGAAPMWVIALAAVLLSLAYLRTRALWFGWGLHFAWLAAIGLLFGQPLAGSRQASSVIHTYADGPTWLTGGEYGPEASVVAVLVLWIALPLTVWLTRRSVSSGA